MRMHEEMLRLHREDPRETGLPIERSSGVQLPRWSSTRVRAGRARAAAALGYSHMPVVSGAGHDAIYVARLAPAGMIFMPCKDGISHNEIEDAQCRPRGSGRCNVLLQAMLERLLLNRLEERTEPRRTAASRCGAVHRPG
jgi:N-carbamoyl-L-amino-acid hydrolase